MVPTWPPSSPRLFCRVTSSRARHLSEEPTDLWHSRLADSGRKGPSFHKQLAMLVSENNRGHRPPVATAGGVLIISDSCCSASSYHRRESRAKSSFPTRVNTASSKASWEMDGESPTCWQRTSFCRATQQDNGQSPAPQREPHTLTHRVSTRQLGSRFTT